MASQCPCVSEGAADPSSSTMEIFGSPVTDMPQFAWAFASDPPFLSDYVALLLASYLLACLVELGGHEP